MRLLSIRHITFPAFLFLTVLFSCQKEYSASGGTIPPKDNETLTVKVLVLNYDPYIGAPGGGKIRLHEYYNWTDPHALSVNYAATIK